MKSDLSPLARFSHRKLENLTIAKMFDPTPNPTPHCPSCHTGSALGAAAILSQTPQDTPRVQLAPEKLKQLLGGLSIQGTKKLTLWYCLLCLCEMQLSCSEQTPHSALAATQLLGCSLHPPALTRHRFCKGDFFFFNLQGTQLNHKCLAPPGL